MYQTHPGHNNRDKRNIIVFVMFDGKEVVLLLLHWIDSPYHARRIIVINNMGNLFHQYLQDTQLILLVCALLLIDGLVLTVWVVMDPMDRVLRNLTLQVSATDPSVIYLPQVPTVVNFNFSLGLSFFPFRSKCVRVHICPAG